MIIRAGRKENASDAVGSLLIESDVVMRQEISSGAPMKHPQNIEQKQKITAKLLASTWSENVVW